MLNSLILLLLVPSLAFADIVFLKSGAAIQGSVSELTITEVTLQRDENLSTKFNLEHVQAIVDAQYNLMYGETTAQIEAYIQGAKSSDTTQSEQAKSIKMQKQPHEMESHGPSAPALSMSETKFGLRGSLNISRLKLDPDDDMNITSIARLVGGLSILSRDEAIGVIFDLYYLNRGVKNSGAEYDPSLGLINYEEKVFISYFGLNPSIMIFFSPKPSTGFLQFGVAYEAKLSSKYEFSSNIGDIGFEPELKAFNIPFIFGIGISHSCKTGEFFMIDIRYLLGLTDIGEQKDSSIKTSDILATISIYY